MADLLIELFSEEIPARMQRKAANDFKDLILASFKEAGLGHEEATAYWTPRRLALAVSGLPAKTQDLREERKGPKEGAPEKAIEGFLRGAGLASIDQAELRDSGKGKAWFAIIEKPGQASADLLPGLISAAIGKLVWPKSMRWGRGSQRWVRPLHSIIAVLDGQVLDGNYRDLEFGDQTLGHRFMSAGAIKVTDFASYKAKLRDAFVILDPQERKTLVQEKAEEVAKNKGLTLIDDQALLEEVTNLVEWPVPILGSFDQAFLDVPPECLILSMKEHQKYFALNDKDGQLANAFVTMANIETANQGEAIRKGNERVLNARLSDARFFWEQDKKASLESRLPKLKSIVFHAAMGSVWDKTQGVEALARKLSSYTKADADSVARAVRLSKADLVTEMVGEFPELQGRMGQYYALNDGEDHSIATAIAEHYSPLGPSDDCPSAPVSVTAALADKLWTLIAFWKIDEKPTGSKDPFALRRAALGAIRLILDNKLRINLAEVLAEEAPDQASDLMVFFADRLKVMLKDRGLRFDSINAAIPRETQGDLTRLIARTEALEAFRKTEAGENLLAAYKRANNILVAEQKKDVALDLNALAVQPKLFELDQELSLGAGLDNLDAVLSPAIGQEDFTAAMTSLADLRVPVDAFFEKVVVNTDKPELRLNRLAILKRLIAAMNQVADFRQLEG